MGSWTLRGFTPRFEYTGEKQDHPAATRALRYVRRHGWQTGPQDPNHWSVHTHLDPFELRCCGPTPEDDDPKCVDCGLSRLLDCECD